MKRIIAALLMLSTLTALAACGGVSDTVERPLGTTPGESPVPVVTTPVPTEPDPVRDGYYEEIENVFVYDDVYLVITHGENSYTVIDPDTVSTLLHAASAAVLEEVEKKGDTVLTIRIYRKGVVDREIHYPYVELDDPDSRKDKVYHATISGWSAEAYVLDILRIDGILPE
jgi:hypothetical protein